MTVLIYSSKMKMKIQRTGASLPTVHIYIAHLHCTHRHMHTYKNTETHNTHKSITLHAGARLSLPCSVHWLQAHPPPALYLPSRCVYMCVCLCVCVCRSPCHVVYTDHRPTPFQQYIFLASVCALVCICVCYICISVCIYACVCVFTCAPADKYIFWSATFVYHMSQGWPGP